MAEITIGNRKIGDGYPTYIIAEMSANHAGSIERAKEIIRAAKEAGADCIKIQTYTPDTLTIDCHNEYFSIDDGLWEGENLYSLYGKAYTPWEWQGELKEEAERVGIDFFSTPFDKSSVDFLENLGVEFYKIASFELVDIPLIEYVASKGKPIILSTGMSTLEEIKEAVEAIERQGNNQYALLKCSSAYPAISDEMNLETIRDMKDRLGVPIGLSDHSMGAVGAIVAVTLGANIIEKHFCISREIENPDAAFSMTKEEFAQMVEDIRSAEKARGIIRYGATSQERNSLVFRKSIFVVKDIKKGDVFSEDNIKVIRPGYGLKPKFYRNILGKKAKQDIKRGMPLNISVIEEKKVYLRRATNDDMELLFKWVNEAECRKNSFNSKEITIEEHENWFNDVIKKDNCKIFIASLYGEDIGQVRIKMEGENIEISYMVALEHRGNGYGKEILNLVEIWLKNNVSKDFNMIGKVKKNNIASVKCFESCGYNMSEKEEYFCFMKKVYVE